MPSIIRFPIRTAVLKKLRGFTLVELLVVIGIIAILAGVALGPITNGIKQAKHNAAVQTGRQLGQVEFSFATDNTVNGNLYPADSSAVALAQDLMNANYVTDPSIFGISSQAGYSKPSTGTASALTSASISWCFTCGTGSASLGNGISAAASDLTPLVFFNNGAGAGPTGATTSFNGSGGITVTYGAAAPFGTDGAAIFYKGNNALYVKSTTGNGAVTFTSATDTDSNAYTVAQ